MGSWRRQLGEIRHQDLKITRSRHRKPPLGSGYVPSWEKQFCTSVGSVPWGKLLDTKKCMYLYDNVVKWDDSAGEEAFHNAKRRFWAKLNGFPCNISLPDPDIYIDEVDWDSNIDPDLFTDLERESNQPICGDENEILSGLGNALGLNQSFWCTGWGEAEGVQKGVLSSGAEHENRDLSFDNGDNSWERGFDNVDNLWNPNASSGRKNWENQNYKWGNNHLWEHGVRDEGWRRWDSNTWNRSSALYNDSSIKDHRSGNARVTSRRGGRKMENFSNGPYRPVSHRVYGNGNRWS